MNKHKYTQNEKRPLKWAAFTYVGKETTYIIKLLKGSNLKIDDKTKNTTKNLLKSRLSNNCDI